MSSISQPIDTPIVSPYGSWTSPITSDVVSGSDKRLGGFAVDSRGQFYWTESRPHESGRSVLVKESPKAEDEPIDITPVGFAVRTVAQEYGGGAFKISGDTVVFSNYKDQRLYKQSIHSKDSVPVPLTPDYGGPLVSYADGEFDSRFGRYVTAKKYPCFDARLSDICISTSAAPTYLPAYNFDTCDSQGNVREFNLIDGGVAANNPTLVAMTEVTKQIFDGNPDFFPIKPVDYGRFLIISVGTGSAKIEQKYDAKSAAKWGVLGWLLHQGSTPLVDVFTQASGDMVDYHLSVVTQALHCEENYLRIQDDTLTGTDSSTDLSTNESLEKLVGIGENLLNKPVPRINLDNGAYERVENGGTNAEELKRFAKLLSQERRLRELRSPHTNKALKSEGHQLIIN